MNVVVVNDGSGNMGIDCHNCGEIFPATKLMKCSRWQVRAILVPRSSRVPLTFPEQHPTPSWRARAAKRCATVDGHVSVTTGASTSLSASGSPLSVALREGARWAAINWAPTL